MLHESSSSVPTVEEAYQLGKIFEVRRYNLNNNL